MLSTAPSSSISVCFSVAFFFLSHLVVSSFSPLTEEEEGWKQAALALKKLVVKLEMDLAVSRDLPQSATQQLSNSAHDHLQAELAQREKVGDIKPPEVPKNRPTTVRKAGVGR